MLLSALVKVTRASHNFNKIFPSALNDLYCLLDNWTSVKCKQIEERNSIIQAS